ncbi:hypothetical protein ES703_03236 [subsurface metagenome]
MNDLENRNSIGYEKRIFAFIDILGFGDLVEESEHDPTKILRIYQLLNRTRETAHLPVSHQFQTLQVDLKRFRSHTFSDTVTMSCPYESFDYFNAMVAWVMQYQYLMWAEEGVFIRGSIVYGDVFDNENSTIVFSPAMISAYRLEKEKAKWPRILVDQSVLNKLPEDKKQRALHEYLRKEGKEIYYLDYLRDLFALTAYDRGRRLKNPYDAIRLIQDHKIAIEREVDHIRNRRRLIQRSDMKARRVLKKYGSLAKYHNLVIDKLCKVVSQLLNDSNLVRNIISETMLYALIRELKRQQDLQLEPEYTAENLKYVDIMPVLGIAIDQIFAEHHDLDGIVEEEPIKLVNFLCEESPKYLSKVEKNLRGMKIDIDILLGR